MKYLMPFYESMDKEVIKIEDMLIRFTDTGELTSYDVDEGTNMISISLIFNKSMCYGYKTLLLCNQIYEILRKRYKYIYCENTCLCIDIEPKKSREYITEPILEIVENIYKNLFDNLNIYTTEQHPEFYFFGKENNKIIFQYDIKDKKVYAMYDPMWKLLENYIFSDNINKALIIRHYIKKYVKITVNDIWNTGWSILINLMKKLELKCKANELY